MSGKTIIIDESAKQDIIEMFGKTVDADGYIVEKDNPKQKILSPDGDEVKIDKFAGITKGSVAFIPSDLNSLMNLSDKMV